MSHAAAVGVGDLVELSDPTVTDSYTPWGPAESIDKAFDGLTNTAYISSDGGVKTYIDFDFGSATLVAGYYHLDRNDTAVIDTAELVFSDTPDFSNIVGAVAIKHAQQPAGETHICFPAVNARYMRWQVLAIDSGAAAVGAVEMTFYTVDNVVSGQIPSDKQWYISSNPALSWQSSANAESFDVYFGTDFDNVDTAQHTTITGDANGNGCVDQDDLVACAEQWLGDGTGSANFNGESTVNFEDFSLLGDNWLKRTAENQTESSYQPGTLQLGTEYFWRVDEVNKNVPHARTKGHVLSFRVGYITIDDFESYDGSNLITGTWDDGSTNLTGSSLAVSSAESMSGSQSVLFGFDNASAPYYSEVSRTYSTAQDWDSLNANVLVVHFRGVSSNPEEPLYVELEDFAANTKLLEYEPVYGILEDFSIERWFVLQIPFEDFNGVDTSQIKSLRLGFGDKTSPSAGGSGQLYIDDIQLENSINKLFPLSPVPADVVDVINITDNSLDDKLYASTLTGQINKLARSQVYLIYNDDDSVWLAQMRHKGHLSALRHLTFDEFITKYNGYYDTAVVYDSALPATINIATMIASTENATVIPVYRMSLYGAGKTIIDLQGDFPDNWTAYQWADDNLWPKMGRRVVANFHPTATEHHIRDYLIAKRVFTTWVTGENVENGTTSDYDLERACVETLWDNAPDGIPIIGWWATGTDDGLTEYIGVGLAGQYGKYCAPCDWTTNLTLIGGTRPDFTKAVSQYHALPKRPTPTLDPAKVYICFNMLDSGDASGYWQFTQHRYQWSDSARGQLPRGWTLGPTAVELLPSVMEWYYDNATPNDVFLMGMSGAAYVHPYRDFLTQVDNSQAEWDAYLGLTQYYMDLLGITQVGVYPDSHEIYRPLIDPITMKFINGLSNLENLIIGFHRNTVYADGPPGTTLSDNNYYMGSNDILVSHPVSHNGPPPHHTPMTRGSAANQWLADDIIDNTPAGRPGFIHAQCVSWTYYPSDVVDVLSRLGSDYVAVSLSEFVELYEQAYPPSP